MDRILEEEAPEDVLPALRDDLEIVKGAPLANGAPSWVIFDPASNKYYEIGREILDQLSLWKVGTVQKLSDRLCSELGRFVSPDEIKNTIHFLISNSLVRDIVGNDYKSIVARHEAGKKSFWKKMAHGYLFFRIPLFRPDKLLRYSWPLVKYLFTRTMVLILTILGITGVYLASRQWEQFVGTFQYMLSLDGLMLYGISLIFVKSLHELGHAFMATKYGLRVPTIGIAFIVLMPILYTDTSAAWRLPSRKKRLMIDAAGIFTELALASIATLVWVFLPDSGLRLAVFTVATTSWVSSLLVNLNPLMRFDGYYILSDGLGFQNLQERGFDMARWRMRDLLFRLGEAPPEQLDSRMRRIIVLHAWATWIYRFFLFIGIAVLVYAFVIKVIGILLFVLEILWFIIMPVFRELTRWWAMRSMIIRSKRSWITFSIFAGIVLLLAVPWSTRVSIPSILAAQHEQKLYPPYSAQLVMANVNSGDRVKKGQLLFQFSSPEVQKDLINVRERASLLRARLDRIGSDEADRTARIVLLNKLKSTQKEKQGLELLLDELAIRAQFDGTIVDMDPEISAGMWISVSQPIALLHGNEGVNVKGYVSEANLFRFSEGASADFIPEDPALGRVSLIVSRISYAGAKHLDEPYLALKYGGSIATSEIDAKKLSPTAAFYSVLLEPVPKQMRWEPEKVVRGNVIIHGSPQSMYERAKRSILSVLVREMGI